ncbi:MAG: NAD(P)-binding protein [Methylococcales bacterium]|jgi:glutamate synthase (NADPH) small chain|nr:NAD(P)-binding protein [Methylococcales bacterium]
MSASSEDMKSKLTWRRFNDGDDQWGSWTENIFDADHSHKCPTYVNKTPPCQGSCPAGEDIRGWLQVVRGIEKPSDGMDMKEYAFRRSTDANPFPSIMGRVCPAPCEDGCNRNEVEDHVGINSVEQFIGDSALENKYDFAHLKPATESGKKVAIIGGGPAGLAAAYQLRRKGHSCTLFDDHSALGGWMRYGIPGYRTPRDVLDGEIQRILDMGVEVKLNTRIGKDISLEQVEKDYDALLWAIGTKSGKGLPIPTFDAPNCVDGVAFLEAFNEKKLQHVPRKLIVVGGGDTSIDVASVARRLGHVSDSHDKDNAENVILGFTAHDVATSAKKEGAEVVLTSLFPIEEMTAAEHEVDDAKREGIEIQGGVMPIEVLKDDEGRAIGLKMTKCTIDKGRPTAVEGSEYTIDCDMIVSAIGQTGDLTGFEELDNGRGLIDADKHYQVPGKEGHFVAGDVVRPHLLTTAIGQASIAAESIDHYLNGINNKHRPKVDVHHYNLMSKLVETSLEPTSFDSQKGEVTPENDLRGTDSSSRAIHNYEDRSANEVIPHDDLFLGHYAFEPRNIRDEKVPSSEEVIGHFEERVIGLSEETAKAEAGRCMSCGMCFECDNCVIYCPQDAVHRTKKTESTLGRYVYTDYNICVGCHICADVCPTGYIKMGMGE